MGALLARIALRRLSQSRAGDVGATAHSFDGDAYAAWRDDCLRAQFEADFDAGGLVGRDVVDFGCGKGLVALRGAGGARSVTGVDLRECDVDVARAGAAAMTEPADVARPSFVCASRTDQIPLPDACADVVLCFDVVEHILDYDAIFAEWRRILRPGGRVMIWWSPFAHPYGHHIESLLPLPWVHVLFSDRVLLDACARVYDDPGHRPRIWDIDPATGMKKPNKWRHLDRLPELNRLTVAGFDAAVRKAGLRIARRELRPFTGGVKERVSRIAIRIPLLRELFVGYTIYELARADSHADGRR